MERMSTRSQAKLQASEPKLSPAISEQDPAKVPCSMEGCQHEFVVSESLVLKKGRHALKYHIPWLLKQATPGELGMDRSGDFRCGLKPCNFHNSGSLEHLIIHRYTHHEEKESPSSSAQTSGEASEDGPRQELKVFKCVYPQCKRYFVQFESSSRHTEKDHGSWLHFVATEEEKLKTRTSDSKLSELVARRLVVYDEGRSGDLAGEPNVIYPSLDAEVPTEWPTSDSDTSVQPFAPGTQASATLTRDLLRNATDFFDKED